MTGQALLPLPTRPTIPIEADDLAFPTLRTPILTQADVLGLDLYAVVRRSAMERLLEKPTSRHWKGDLVVGRDAALIFANLDTGRWHFESPGQLRMVLRGRLNPSSGARQEIVPQLTTDNAAIVAKARRRWRPFRPNVPTHAFALQSGGSRYVYLGTTRPGPSGWGSNAFGTRAHMDCRIRPPVPIAVWKELRSHRLELDGRTIDRGPDGEPLSLWNLGEVLDQLRRRRRVEAKVFRRGLGDLSYSKVGRSCVLRYQDNNGRTREAAGSWEQGAQDALTLFWTDGLLAPWFEWL